MAGIPASAPLANVGMPGIGRPAVAAGAVTIATVAEENKRKRKLEALSPDVTDAELGDAVFREAAAVAQLLPAPAVAHLPAGAAGPPPWFAGAVAGAVAAANAPLLAAQANHRRYARNAAALLRSATGGEGEQLQLVAKENVGFGPVPPAFAAAFPAVPPVPGPAAFPPAQLPQHITTTVGITQAQIAAFAAWYNDDFGIVPADTVPERRKKFHEFLAGR
ncbi:unnamed protein product [Symbiodinium sp. CCMP2456]|nr:unnamed protein product [Symbiodinium sp. CCMP2456]